MPFTPYSVTSAGVAMWPMRMCGISVAHGTIYSPKLVASGLALRVERQFLIERRADALGDAADDLSVDDHWIDHRSAILDDHIVEDLHDAGLRLDRDYGGVRAVGEDAGGIRRLVGLRRFEQRRHALGQHLRPDVGDAGDFDERDGAHGAEHLAGLDPRLRDLRLQQMRADRLDLRQHRAARLGDGAAAEHHAARREGAEAERAVRRVAVADRDFVGRDRQLVRRHLGERGLEPLPMVLHADMDDDRSIGQDAHLGGFIARHHHGPALRPFDRAVPTLLGIEAETEPEPPPVRLAALLPRPHHRNVDHLSRLVETGRIIAIVEPEAAGRHERHLRRSYEIAAAHLERIKSDGTRHLVDRPLDRETGAGPRHAAIGAHRRLVGRDRVGRELDVFHPIGARQAARGHTRLHEGACRPQRIGAGIDVDVAGETQQPSLAVGEHFELVEVVARMDGGDEVLAPVLDPAHGAAALQRQGPPPRPPPA